MFCQGMLKLVQIYIECLYVYEKYSTFLSQTIDGRSVNSTISLEPEGHLFIPSIKMVFD